MNNLLQVQRRSAERAVHVRNGSFPSILARPQQVRLRDNLGSSGRPILPVQGVDLDVIQVPKPGHRVRALIGEQMLERRKI